MKQLTKLAAAITLGLALSAAHAATASNTFTVKIELTGTCDATAFTGNATSDIDFGTHVAQAADPNLSANNNGGTTLAVQCSKDLPFNVGLTPTNNNTAGAGIMAGDAGGTVAYELMQPTAGNAPANTAAWGNVVGTNTVARNGNGLATADAVKLPVTALVRGAGAINQPAGDYEDTVTATLTY